jgi:hypothetical protein
MASSNVAQLASAIAAAVWLLTLAGARPVAAQSDQKIPICQATGSPTNPWVFTAVDAQDLPEHLAKGDYRASSIADCTARATAVTTPPPAAPAAATATPTVSATPGAGAGSGPTSKPVQQESVLGGVPVPELPVSRLVAQATATPAPATQPAPVATPTGTASRANVAGAQATPETEVSTLPKSGGEPDRTPWVLACLGLVGTGYALRRLARAHG